MDEPPHATVDKRCRACGAEYPADLTFCPDDGQPLEPIDGARLVPGSRVGPYRVHRFLGRGGMGTVYECEHEVLGRRAAVKMLLPELGSDPQMAARFRREARAAGRIDDPHVVRVYDVGAHADGRLFLAMELLEGETLLARLEREGALAPREAVRVARSIARGLCAAHAAGVVHRDLKPENVMLTASGGVKILDLGVARLLDTGPDDARLTRAGSVIGTPLYISPEGARRARVGPEADLYSLGVVLFEMLVGRPPFVDDDAVLVLGMHLRMWPERLREARPGLVVPDSLEDLVDRLLAKEPAARGSLEELLGELEALERIEGLGEVVEGRAVAPKAIVVGTRAAGPSVRRIGLLVLAAALAGAALLGAGWVALRPDPTAEVAGTPPAALPNTETEEVAVEPVAPDAPAPEPITLSIGVSPPGATVTLDGEPIENPSVLRRAPQDREAMLEARAPGRRTERRSVRLDASRTIALHLHADRRARRARRPPPPVEPGHRAGASGDGLSVELSNPYRR